MHTYIQSSTWLTTWKNCHSSWRARPDHFHNSHSKCDTDWNKVLYLAHKQLHATLLCQNNLCIVHVVYICLCPCAFSSFKGFHLELYKCIIIINYTHVLRDICSVYFRFTFYNNCTTPEAIISSFPHSGHHYRYRYLCFLCQKT